MCNTENVQPVVTTLLGRSTSFVGYYILPQNALYDMCILIIDIDVRNADELWDMVKTKRGGSWKYLDNDRLSFEISCGPKKGRCCESLHVFGHLGTFATDTAGQLDVLWHDGDTFGVDCAQVGVLEETDQVGFTSFLQGQHG